MRFGDIFFRDFVEVDGTYYMLDMRHTWDAGTECMAFRCAKSGEVTSGEDVWSKRGMDLTRREFNKCKREFRDHIQKIIDAGGKQWE